MLEVLPQVARLSYRGDGNEIVFTNAVHASGERIVDKTDLSDPASPWSNERTFLAAVRHTEIDLETAEVPIDRWLDIDVNDAIAKAAARLG